MSRQHSDNAIHVWDFTLKKEAIQMEELKLMLDDKCKRWVFQLERGESGYEHYQGRFSLKVKTRRVMWGPKEMYISITHCADDDFYVTKEETRIDGPWRNDDGTPVRIPRHLRGLQPVGWQKDMVSRIEADKASSTGSRRINVVYDPKGCSGKSTVSMLMELQQGCIGLPPINDAKELMQVICCVLLSRDPKNRNPPAVFLDLPRALEKERMYGIYNAIEQIKNGKAFDTRNKYKCVFFDNPAVWMFMNEMPDLTKLSADRWVVWEIKGKGLTSELTQIYGEDPDDLDGWHDDETEEEEGESWDDADLWETEDGIVYSVSSGQPVPPERYEVPVQAPPAAVAHTGQDGMSAGTFLKKHPFGIPAKTLSHRAGKSGF